MKGPRARKRLKKIALKHGGYYVVEMEVANNIEVMVVRYSLRPDRRDGGVWYETGSEQSCPFNWVRRVVRRIRL